ncbi:PIN-like domain-containing protein [Streptomyces sp. NPDC057636]|uniref:PIN-like domain-containing protein n=1 Tax=Streptomyces sp. NPDC057636 TaxID=3346189 RepID=UPI0036CBD065
MTKYHKGTFTDGYEGYWRKDKADVEEAIKSSVITLDTNALLSIYRMERSAREEYFAVLDALAPRIWIPRQVADEFHRNRISSLDTHLNTLHKKSEAVNESIKELRKNLRDLAKLRSLAGPRSEEYMQPFNEALSGIESRIESDLSGFDLSTGGLASRDPILERLSVLLDGKVGEKPNERKKSDLEEEARRRGEGEIPPGYKDFKSKGEAGLGDCLLWLQMVEYAMASSQNILFVSTDVKDDWIRYQCGLAIGPRPELIEEMQLRAGANYHHVTLSELLSRSGQVLEVSVSQNTIDQATERQKHQTRQRELGNQRAAIADELSRVSNEMGAAKEVLSAQKSELERLVTQFQGLQDQANKAPLDEREQHNAALIEAHRHLQSYSTATEDLATVLRKLAEKELRLFSRLRNMDAVLSDQVTDA